MNSGLARTGSVSGTYAQKGFRSGVRALTDRFRSVAAAASRPPGRRPAQWRPGAATTDRYPISSSSVVTQDLLDVLAHRMESGNALWTGTGGEHSCAGHSNEIPEQDRDASLLDLTMQLAAPRGANLRHCQQEPVEAANGNESDKTPGAVSRGEIQNTERQRDVPILKPERE
jgi:hypothetical protein